MLYDESHQFPSDDRLNFISLGPRELWSCDLRLLCTCHSICSLPLSPRLFRLLARSLAHPPHTHSTIGYNLYGNSICSVYNRLKLKYTFLRSPLFALEIPVLNSLGWRDDQLYIAIWARCVCDVICVLSYIYFSHSIQVECFMCCYSSFYLSCFTCCWACMRACVRLCYDSEFQFQLMATFLHCTRTPIDYTTLDNNELLFEWFKQILRHLFDFFARCGSN